MSIRFRNDEISIGDLLMAVAVWVVIATILTTLGAAALICAAIDAFVSYLFKSQPLKAHLK